MTVIKAYNSTAAEWEPVVVGKQGPQGPTGATGATGPGVAAGGNTGQVLAKSSSTDYATTWVTPTPTDATYVTLSTNGTLTNERVLTAGTGISITDAGAGSSATVATSAILPTIVDAKGDLIAATGADAVARLAVSATDGHVLKAASGEATGLQWQGQSEVIVVAISDETTAITTGTAKVTFRMPFAMTLTAVRASLTTASSSGLPTFDINESGSSILSTAITIDANELTSTTAATPPVISDTALADDAQITIDVDVAGTGAKGAKVYLIGRRV